MTITAVAAVWPSSEDGPGAGVVGGVGGATWTGATWTGATWTGATWGGLLSGTAAAVSIPPHHSHHSQPWWEVGYHLHWRIHQG